jgi:hypothetical protein
MEQLSGHITRELACPGGNATITSRRDDLWSSSGRSNGAATGAKSNAATARTKTHSVIVIAQMIARAPKSRNTLGEREAYLLMGSCRRALTINCKGMTLNRFVMIASTHLGTPNAAVTPCSPGCGS